jgi:hypothetical protein
VLEDTRQSLFDGLCCCAKLASGDWHKCPLKMFSDQFGRQGLPHTRWAANTTCQQKHNATRDQTPLLQEDVEPLPFSFYNIVKGIGRRLLDMGFGKSLHDLLLLCGNVKVI